MIVAIAFLLLGCYLLYRFQPQARPFVFFYWGALTLRILAGLALGVFYSFWVQNGDTTYFYQEGFRLYQLALEQPLVYVQHLIASQFPHYESASRDGFFVKIVSLVLLISGGSYWVATVWFSILSFFPVWFLVRNLTRGFRENSFSALLAFFLLPSLLFWSSGLLKDTVLVSALFYLLTIGLKYERNERIGWMEALGTVVCLFVLIKLRYFLFGAVFLIYLILIFRKVTLLPISRKIMWPALTVITLVCIYWVSTLNYNLNYNHLPQSVYDNYQTILQNSKEGNTLLFPSLEATWTSLIIHLPLGFFSGIFRPLPWEGSPFIWVARMETITLLIFSFLSLYLILFRKANVRFSFPFWIVISYVAVLASFMALASPNFGTLLRYRAVYYPFCLYLASLLPFSVSFPKQAE